MPLSDLSRILRPRLLLLNSLAAFTGGLLFRGDDSLAPWLATAAVALLAAGATVLNQWQERHLDARMKRTTGRPLARGSLQPLPGLLLALVLLAGALLLLLWLQPEAAGWGLLAVLLYNGGYTLLKPHTPLALFPGALCGALPLVVGWSAVGGAVLDYRILLPAGLLVLWQLPHFWLLAWLFREDYRQAGLPLVSDWFDDRQMVRLTHTWLLCLLPACLLLPLFDIVQQPRTSLALLAGLALFAFRLLWPRSTPVEAALRRQFRDVNLLMLMVLLVLVLDCV